MPALRGTYNGGDSHTCPFLLRVPERGERLRTGLIRQQFLDVATIESEIRSRRKLRRACAITRR